MNVNNNFFILKSFEIKKYNSKVRKNFCKKEYIKITDELEKWNKHITKCENMGTLLSYKNSHYIEHHNLKELIFDIHEQSCKTKNKKLHNTLNQLYEESGWDIDIIKIFQIPINKKSRLICLNIEIENFRMEKKEVWPIFLDLRHSIYPEDKGRGQDYSSKSKENTHYFEVKNGKCITSK